jgi:hypothetical protein
MPPQTDDPTMELMRQTAGHIGPPPALPLSLRGATIREANENRTVVLKAVGNAIDADLRPVQNAAADPYDVPPQVPVLAARLLQDKALDALTANLLPDVADQAERINIALRLTAGYLDAAKTIAGNTRSVINDASTRQRDIPTVEANAVNDPIYTAGVEAAPHYKHRDLKQDIFRDGIPDGSIVLRDWEDYMNLSWSELSAIVKASLQNLDSCDHFLLVNEVAERSITHKLGEYVRDQLEKKTGQNRAAPAVLSVDCEYNRFGLDGDPKALPWSQEISIEDGGPYYTANPDIIIHERGYQRHNTLAIELKTYFNGAHAVVLFDKMKVLGYLDSPTNYPLGLYLCLGLKGERIDLIEARLAERQRMHGMDAAGKAKWWTRGNDLLVEPDSKKQRPPLRTPNAALNHEAGLIVPELEKAYGFRDVVDDLKWY